MLMYKMGRCELRMGFCGSAHRSSSPVADSCLQDSTARVKGWPAGVYPHLCRRAAPTILLHLCALATVQLLGALMVWLEPQYSGGQPAGQNILLPVVHGLHCRLSACVGVAAGCVKGARMLFAAGKRLKACCCAGCAQVDAAPCYSLHHTADTAPASLITSIDIQTRLHYMCF